MNDELCEISGKGPRVNRKLVEIVRRTGKFLIWHGAHLNVVPAVVEFERAN
jgi:hypothetical protein